MRSLVLTLGAVMFALLLAEGLLRLIGQSYYWAVAKQPDPQLGWRPAPGVSAWQRFEGEALVETSTLGFRDVEHTPNRVRHQAGGGVRVVVLGDSFTEAVQVPLEQTWWRIMQHSLNAQGCGEGDWAGSPAGQGFEVLNFAVSGYSTAQALLAWRHVASRFAPDAVILAFFLGNDLVENAKALDAEPLRPYLAPHGRDLVLDDGFLASDEYRFKTSAFGRIIDRLVVHSRLAQTLVQVRHAVSLHRRIDGDEPGRRSLEPGVDDALYREPADDAWQGAWSATESMLAAFAREVRQSGAQPLLMLAGTGAQVHPNPRVPAAVAAGIGVEDLGYPVRRLLQTADAQQLPVVNLPELMAKEAEQRQDPLHGFDNSIIGFGHWNAAGHRVAGRAATDALCALLGGGS